MFKSKAIRLNLIILITAFTACSSQPKQPEWVQSPHTAYPEQSYLTAIGLADDPQTAGDRAIANLAKIFEVAVHDVSTDNSTATFISNQAGSLLENEQSITREIRLETKKVLQGAKVVQSWTSDTGQQYALAVLAKHQAAKAFSQQVKTIDKKINDLMNYARRDAHSPLAALSAVKEALGLQHQRDEHNRHLMVVQNSRGITGQYNTASIEQFMREALASLKVQINADNPWVKAELEQALAQLGVKTVEQSNLILAGSIDVAPVSQQQGWYWQRGAYELIFKDNQKVLAKQRYPMKVSSRDPAMVEQRLKDQLNNNLSGYVFSLMSSKTQ